MTDRRSIDDPRRRILVRALSLGLLSSFPAGLARAQAFGAPGKLPEGQCIFRITGDVSVNGKPADLKTVIKAGDTVKTGKGAEVVFVVGTQAMILRGGTELAIETPRDASLFARGMRMLTGALL